MTIARIAIDIPRFREIVYTLLALSGRRFGAGFYLLMLFAVAVNLFGAVTFDRSPVFYHRDLMQRIYFQPD